MVDKWVKDLTEEVLGKSQMKIGKIMLELAEDDFLRIANRHAV